MTQERHYAVTKEKNKQHSTEGFRGEEASESVESVNADVHRRGWPQKLPDGAASSPPNSC